MQARVSNLSSTTLWRRQSAIRSPSSQRHEDLAATTAATPPSSSDSSRTTAATAPCSARLNAPDIWIKRAPRNSDCRRGGGGSKQIRAADAKTFVRDTTTSEAAGCCFLGQGLWGGRWAPSSRTSCNGPHQTSVAERQRAQWVEARGRKQQCQGAILRFVMPLFLSALALREGGWFQGQPSNDTKRAMVGS